MADLAFCFHLKQQPAAVMAKRRKCQFEDKIEQSLLGELTASDQSSCSDDDDSSSMDDFTVGEVIGSECSDNESDDVQFATASSVPSALSATFMWENMTNYVGQREQFVDNCGPQNKALNKTHCAKVFWWQTGRTNSVRNKHLRSTKNTSQKFHSIVFQNAGLETCH